MSRLITNRPRVVGLVERREGLDDKKANTEGCVVVCDDPEAIKRSGFYNGPDKDAPDLSYVSWPAHLPGRKYLTVLGEDGKPIKSINPMGMTRVPYPPEKHLVLTDGFGTVYPTWQHAENAADEATAVGLFGPDTGERLRKPAVPAVCEEVEGE